MEKRRAVHLRDRRDQKVDRRRAAVLAPFRESCLNTRRGALAPIVEPQVSDLCEVRGKRAIIDGPASREKQLEANRRAQSEFVRFE